MAGLKKPAHPTDERTAEPSTPSASGLSAGRPHQMANTGGNRATNALRADEDLIGRNQGKRHDTPRRYEADADQNPNRPGTIRR